MLKKYKYKFWPLIAKIAGSPDNIEIVCEVMAAELEITKEQLISYLNIDYSDNVNDIPADVFIKICFELETTFEEVCYYDRPEQSVAVRVNGERRSLSETIAAFRKKAKNHAAERKRDEFNSKIESDSTIK